MTRTMTCDCEAVISAEDTESLIGPVKAHFDEAHPEFEETLATIRNYLESEDRSTGPTERLATIGEVEILPMGLDSTVRSSSSTPMLFPTTRGGVPAIACSTHGRKDR